VTTGKNLQTCGVFRVKELQDSALRCGQRQQVPPKSRQIFSIGHRVIFHQTGSSN